MNESMETGKRENLKTILVVEDEPAVRECIAIPLRRAGYRVLIAGDGVEGSVLFARNFESIDLLMTDISMPGMEGTDLARYARTIRADIKVIFASGSVSLIEPHPSTIVPGAKFLNKPFTTQEMLQAVSGMLGQRATDSVLAHPIGAAIEAT